MSSILRSTALIGALAAFGMHGGATVVQRPQLDYSDPPFRMGTPWKGSGNNRSPGPSRAMRRRLRKIARKSRRYNLRMGA